MAATRLGNRTHRMLLNWSSREKRYISSGAIPVSQLKEVFRQSGKSLIVENAHCCQRQIPNYLENVGYATWKLNYQESSCEVVIKTELASEESPEPDVAADKELGSGSGAVYVYYFDIYRKLANLENKARWPCKVGMTDRDAISRVISQAGTAYPELPHVALVLKTDTPRELEAALHAALKFKKRHMTAAPGKEWFQTTPEEVESLYKGLTA